MILKHKKRFYALPNMKANAAIVPEYVEVVVPETLANRVLAKIQDPQWQKETSRQLKSLGKTSWIPVDLLIQYVLFGALIHEMDQRAK